MAAQGMISRSNTTQIILDRMRKDIILCKYQNGDQVRELELASKYNASRAAVRNALMVLEQEGLIVAKNNGTKRIKLLTAEDIHDIYDLRSHMENKAIEQIFHRPGRDFSKLMEIMNEIGRSVNEPVEEILTLDAAFHRETIAISGNRAITQAWDIMDGVTEAIFNLNMMESPEYKAWFIETVVDRHRQLLGALLTDEQKSKELYYSHIQDARNVTIKTMERILGGKHADK